MQETILSIGHSQHNIDYFINMLKRHQVNYILDVRSTPYSQFASDYNRDSIRILLSNYNITYSFMGEYFGARPSEKSLYADKGYLDFEKYKKSEIFIKGYNNVLKGVAQGNRVAFMCTEKDPIDCHRAILVTRAFAEAGVPIEHIMADNSIQTQNDLDQRLLKIYYPDRKQLSIFDKDNLSDEEYLQQAYKKQNEKIGYSLDNELKKRIV